MSVTVDPRLAARRNQVHETWARRRMRWVVALTVTALLAGAGYAALQSPWLAVRTVTISGVENADIADVLATHEVTPGTPTVGVHPAAVSNALEDDPWVMKAEVIVTWPGSVEVVVMERRPSAWVKTGDTWALVATDGVVVALGTPLDGAPVMRSAVGDGLAPGDAISDPDAAGAIELLGALPAEMSVGATARATPTGIEAEVGGHRILVGTSRDIEEKVATLAAIFDEGVAPESVINIISPSRPGVTEAVEGADVAGSSPADAAVSATVTTVPATSADTEPEIP